MTSNDYKTLSEAANLLPHRPHASAVWRWCRRGALARNGERIRLPHVRAGRRLLVSEAELFRFLERVAAADVAGLTPETPRTTPSRKRMDRMRECAAADADAELERRGL